MKRILISILILSIGCLITVTAKSQQRSTPEKITNETFDPATLLWYNNPAVEWDQALPVGNGRLGAMVFGNTDVERIQLNEDTYWSGGPYSQVVNGGYKYLPKIQQLVFDGEWLKAQKLFGRELMGYPVEQQKYQPLAHLILSFDYGEEYTDYKRWLDLETGMTSVQYTANDVTYHRDIFSSIPDQIIVVRLTANKPGSISFTANLRGVRNQTHSEYATDYFQMDGADNDGLVLTGKSADYLGVEGKLRYEARIKAMPEGGDMTVAGDDLVIKNANAVTLYFVAATNFKNYKDVSTNQHARVLSDLKEIQDKSYKNIKEAHLKNYKEQFDRVTLKLPVTSSSFKPTNARIKENLLAPDPALAALAYQFGRYVLISSSQPGTQAANLQGIWNKDSNPMWDSKYTTNINLEMNYWAVESANLSELFAPFTQLVKELTDQGAQVAEEHYGANGWVFHQNTDLWRVAAPMDGPTWGTFTTGGAWLTNQLWDHYLYTMDKEYLQNIYPAMKGSVRFFMDFLVKQPNGKWFVTNPSNSPENFPARPGNKPFFDEVTASIRPGTNIAAGSSIDMQILDDLFGYYIRATKILDTDHQFATKVAKKRELLLPPQIGKNGALQEWAQDWGQMEEHHRHASPLYGLYPGNVFSFSKTPQFIDPIKAVLNQRGDGSSGWSRAWKISLWARLQNGNRANKILKGYFNKTSNIQLFDRFDSGISHMQIDGTMGVTAGITEMLMQSQQGKIVLLPALPDEWSSGTFKGVVARGAFEIDMQWENKKIVQGKIVSKEGGLCRLDAGKKVQITHGGKKVKVKKMSDGSVQFMTTKGETYIFN